MIDLTQKWNVERDGKRFIIRNQDGRILAALAYVTDDDVAQCDLLEMIAAAPLAMGVCAEFLRVWRDGSRQLDQVVRYAEVVVEKGGTMITGNDIQRVETLEGNLERALENVERLEGKVGGLQALTRTLAKNTPFAERWRMVVDLWRAGELIENVETYIAEHNVTLADAVRIIHKAWDQCGRPGSGTEDKQMEIEG